MIEEASDAQHDPTRGHERERDAPAHVPKPASTESGGPRGPEPTRYGDWEKNGRCIDFQQGGAQ